MSQLMQGSAGHSTGLGQGHRSRGVTQTHLAFERLTLAALLRTHNRRLSIEAERPVRRFLQESRSVMAYPSFQFIRPLSSTVFMT